MHNKEDKTHLCIECCGKVEQRHYEYLVKNKQAIRCMGCRDEVAKQVKHCIVPMDKVAYMLVTNMETLKQLNPKRTT